MNILRGALMVTFAIVSGCGDPGAPQYSGTPPPVAAAFGACAFCHTQQAEGVLPVAATLTCSTCHADAIPGFAGPAHRTVPGAELVPSFPSFGHQLFAEEAFGSCSFCHNSTALRIVLFRDALRCETCHVAALGAGFGPRHRTLPDSTIVPNPPAEPHVLGGEVFWGSCALCHNEAARDLQALLGLARIIECSTCHLERTPGQYGAGHATLPTSAVVPSSPERAHRPGAERSWGECVLCHNEVARDLQEFVAAPSEIACTTCHTERTPGQFGAGHYTLPANDIVPSPPERAHRPKAERSWGTCVLCHNEEGRNLESVLGAPSDVRCESCHADLLPGEFRPGHRQRPPRALVPDPPVVPHRPSDAAAASGSCAFCHAGLATNVAAVATELSCVACHQDSTPGAFGPGHRRKPEASLVPAFVGADHAPGSWARFGSCVYCHRDLVENVEHSNASELGCVLCHATQVGPFGPGHRSLPGKDLVPSFVGADHRSGDGRVFGTCTFCHRTTTDRALQFTHGSLTLECSQCHAGGEAEAFGPGHRTVTACVVCHGDERTTHHDPALGTPYECANCHEPHGAENLFLIREFLLTPQGEVRAVRFENLRGQDDGGFTSLTQPGSGLCEICHTTTRFFRNDGTGEPHFGFPCFTCHPHALGFSVKP